ncbi:MAG: hypothetical protein ACOX9R_18375 [Armatimonadota bacterium]|jgi:hypothetical protein
MRATAIIVTVAIATTTAAAQDFDRWPPRDYLVESLVRAVPGILNTYDPDTGRFGGEPWICTDQNVIFPLAAAWSIEHPENPFHHSEEVLAAIAGGGVALVEAQDEAGRWRFDKKDGSYWGQIHMPWTYSRWIRAYYLVGDALPDDVRATWEEGLLLGYERIAAPYPNQGVHNIPVHHAMGLYIAGVAFDNGNWRERSRQFMARAVEEQDPGGFWSENQGPVVGYNFVYSDSLGIYYHFAQDPVVLDALGRTARFHASILWPDGSSVACIDERNTYSRSIRIGDPGFSHTPEGRGYLLAQMQRNAGDALRPIAADMAAALLLYGGDGEVVMPEEIGEDGVVILGDADALVRTGDRWSWAFSAYTAEVPGSRWIQDRQNLVDLFHADLGLVAGGGNTKLQPHWSTFTLGDTTLLRHIHGDESPNFTPEIDLAWTPDAASVSRDGDLTRLQATMVPRTRFDRQPLLAEGFEDTAPGKLPADWSVDYGPAAALSATAEVGRESARALHLVDDGTSSVGLRSPKLPATPGEVYYVEGWWLGGEENNAAIYLEFWDDQQRIDGGIRTFTGAGTGEWRRIGGTARAPEGTMAVTLLAYSATSAVTDGYFDDLLLGRLVPEDRADEAVECSVEVRTDGEDLLLSYRTEPGVGVQAHLPLMLRGARLDLATGESLALTDEPIELAGEQIGDHFIHADLRVSVPDGASIRWPALQHNPYTRDGSSGLHNARLVLVLPFEQTAESTVRLSAIEPEPFDGVALEARDLPFEHSEGTYTRRLDELGSQFIGGTEIGDWIRFTLPDVEPGRYELLGDFVLAHSYAIVEVLLDGEVVGDPFDGYWTGVDASGTMESFGEVQLGEGEHTLTVRIAGRNPEATGQWFSVRRWLLRPVE